MKKKWAIGILTVAVAVGASAQITVPEMINYQGMLRDGEGNAVTSGPYIVEFRIWDHPSGGDALWGKEYPVHVLADGTFNVILGDGGGEVSPPITNSLRSAFDGEERYLALTVVDTPLGVVASPDEISPRQRLLSAPYALRSYETDHADELGDNVAYAAGAQMVVRGPTTFSNAVRIAGGDLTVDAGHKIEAENYTVKSGSTTFGDMRGGNGTLGQGVASKYVQIEGQDADVEIATRSDGNISLYAADKVIVNGTGGGAEVRGPVKMFGGAEWLVDDVGAGGTYDIDEGHTWTDTPDTDAIYVLDVDNCRAGVTWGGHYIALRSIRDDDANYGSHSFPVAKGEEFKVKYEENYSGFTILRVYRRKLGY